MLTPHSDLSSTRRRLWAVRGLTFLNKIVPFARPLLQLLGKFLLDVCSLLHQGNEVLAEPLPVINPPENGNMKYGRTGAKLPTYFVVLLWFPGSQNESEPAEHISQWDSDNTVTRLCYLALQIPHHCGATWCPPLSVS